MTTSEQARAWAKAEAEKRHPDDGEFITDAANAAFQQGPALPAAHDALPESDASGQLGLPRHVQSYHAAGITPEGLDG